MIESRRPYLTVRVADGLESIAKRTSPESGDEEAAVIWMHRVLRWRLLQSAQLDPQDAERLSPERGAGSNAGSPGDLQETP